MKNRRLFELLFGACVVLLFLSIFIFFSDVFLLLFTKNENGDDIQRLTGNFRLTTYNRHNNEITTSFTSIPKNRLESSPHKFLFESTEDKLFLVSRFEDDVYECTGTCYCSEYDRRVASIGRNLLILVAGSIGIGLKEYSVIFDDECRKMMAEDVVDRDFRNRMKECPPGSVVSEFEECKKRLESKRRPEPTYPLEYRCKGHCETDKKDIMIKKWKAKYDELKQKKDLENRKIRPFSVYRQDLEKIIDDLAIYSLHYTFTKTCRFIQIEAIATVTEKVTEVPPMIQAERNFLGHLESHCLNAKKKFEEPGIGKGFQKKMSDLGVSELVDTSIEDEEWRSFLAEEFKDMMSNLNCRGSGKSISCIGPLEQFKPVGPIEN